MSSKLAAAATYLGLMTLVVYGAMNRGDPDFGVWMLAPLVFVQFAAGFFVGRWWAIAAVVVVVAVVWTTLIPENRLICSVLRAQYRP